MDPQNNNEKELLDSCIGLIYLAEQILKSCRLKKQKVHTYSRYVVAFYFRRALQMLKSFIVLIKEGRFVDSAVILRSLCDMNINLGWITSDTKKKEINALKYMLKGETDQQKLLEDAYDSIKEIDSSIDKRRIEIKENITFIKEKLIKKYKITKWGLPSLRDRAKNSGKIIFNYYTQVYGYYSNIEHHSMFFGKYYVDWSKCEPKDNLEEVATVIFFRSELLIYLFRGLFLVILSKFNKEFHLKHTDIISDCLKTHASELNKIGKPPKLNK